MEELTAHMQAAGYERAAWKVVDGRVIFDQIHDLGTIEDVLSYTPEDLREYIEHGH